MACQTLLRQIYDWLSNKTQLKMPSTIRFITSIKSIGDVASTEQLQPKHGYFIDVTHLFQQMIR